MSTQAEKTPENKNWSLSLTNSQKQNVSESDAQFTDNRAETSMQRNLQVMANTGSHSSHAVQLQAIASSYSNNIIQAKGIEDEETLQGKFNTIQKQSMEEEELLQGKFETVQKVEDEELLQGKFNTIQKQSMEEEMLQGKFETVQKKRNETGLPDNLKSGIENQSGIAIDDVKVHFNSDKPAQLNAHAYAQGTDIHVAPGQEKHLPHEAWHVVQQKQGRVKPTMQMKGKVNVNDDEGLEKEADVMGEKALQMQPAENQILESVNSFTPKIQMVLIDPTQSGLNASLTKQYHDEEDNGDACSVSSKSILVHQQAIVHYKSAIQLRKRAGKLHQDEDGGHILAIGTLSDKIQKRKEFIAELTPKDATSSPKVKSEGKKGPSNWFGQKPMGTGGQASWLPGNQSAWEPRKTGT